MLPLVTIREPVILKRCKLTPPERRVWDAITTGQVVRMEVGDPERDDPATGASWGRERSIRGQLLAELLADGGNSAAPPARFLRLQGARITGGLDLEALPGSRRGGLGLAGEPIRGCVPPGRVAVSADQSGGRAREAAGRSTWRQIYDTPEAIDKTVVSRRSYQHESLSLGCGLQSQPGQI